MARFSEADIDRLIDACATFPFFPPSTGAQAVVKEEFAKMLPSLEALDWLRDMVLSRVKTWPGLSEIRGMLYWKFPPADGIPAECSISGFTAEDGERLYLEGCPPPKALPAGRVSECAQLSGMIEDLALAKAMPIPCCNLMGRRTDGGFCDCAVGELARQVEVLAE